MPPWIKILLLSLRLLFRAGRSFQERKLTKQERAEKRAAESYSNMLHYLFLICVAVLAWFGLSRLPGNVQTHETVADKSDAISPPPVVIAKALPANQAVHESESLEEPDVTTRMINTKYGELRVVANSNALGGLITLTLGGKTLMSYEGDGIDIAFAHPRKMSSMVVLRFYPGGKVCPAQYRILDLKGPHPALTKYIGDCYGDLAKFYVSGSNDLLLTLVPTGENTQAEHWNYTPATDYEDGQLRLR